ncbi:ATP-binding cassette domain-containing protein [Nitratidesulfovibrio sp. SRB-5]|uniref:ATP-binding cassette domain-containing protein n=1 Tax=Nitratidesulfovibrio sp. SRB-5 TaxID=2872636 RepID=UPI001027F124|nr:ATP-binding cassette domain-containing protein [Nitratidesulfovibrio sp. SRB-5]MBZ2173552.1 ATP-binding cassette domain-containing protein [Nitratidesulfovibrio sp. SRB-5]RXF78306.1 ATP-binding cassette domain-containing protein [Desulfovibrio sp. DS-1]
MTTTPSHHADRAAPLAVLDNVRVSFGGRRALDGASWTLRAGECWAVFGRNGAGKSTLLRVVRGTTRPDQIDGGQVTWYPPANDDAPASPGATSPGEAPASEASPGETSPLTGRALCASVSSAQQERYVRQGWLLTGEELLLTGYFDTPLLYEDPGAERIAAARDLARRLGAAHLLDVKVPAMSQGQLRLMLVARALVRQPAVLLLDEVCEGLDATARAAVLGAVDQAAALGVTVLFATHRTDQLPACLSRALLVQGGRIMAEGPLGEVMANLPADSGVCGGDGLDIPDMTVPAASGVNDVSGVQADPASPLPPVLARIERADVYVERVHVLHAIDWTIRRGENWCIIGPNGSGKSTLLRLLHGEENVAVGGDIVWFADEASCGVARREPPQQASLRDLPLLHRRVALVSDQLQATYGYDLTAEELVLTGFSGTIGLYDEPDDDQRAEAAHWLRMLGAAGLAGQRIRTLSTGQLRRVLLARALAGAPDLLLLDEPCSGLDPASRAGFLALLGQLARAGVQMVLVTHHEGDLIPEISHVLRLADGRVTRCVPRDDDGVVRDESE